MGIAPDLNPLLDHLRGVAIPEDIAGDDALEVARGLMRLRNVIDHLTARTVGVLDRCGVAAGQGRTLRELLMSLGCAPSVAELSLIHI